jgi:predicted RNase H-like HicB family nuclease
MAKISYMVIIEKAKRNFSAFAPDLPGCVATGRTERQTLRHMEEAIQFHIEGLREDGEPIPPPRATSHQVELDLSAA